MATKTIVLVTGANSGIGYETATALFASPTAYHIFVACRGDVTRAVVAIESIKAAYPDSASTAVAILLDISSDESVAAAFKEIEESVDRIDVLINNAGKARSPVATGLAKSLTFSI